MPNKVFVNDTPLIKLDCVTDITNVVSGWIDFKNPGGTTGSWVATITNDPDTGNGRYLEYQTSGSDLGTEGGWKFQARVVFADGRTFRGGLVARTIHDEWEGG